MNFLSLGLYLRYENFYLQSYENLEHFRKMFHKHADEEGFLIESLF